MSDHDPSGICEHGEIRAACIECIGKPYTRPRKAPPPPKPTQTPRSSEDRIAALSGTKDISVPVFKVQPYLGERTDWLLAQGYPHDLRPGGWIYLRCADGLRGRVRVRRMGWREKRPWRTGQEAMEFGDAAASDGAGPGLVFNLHPDTWEPVSIELGDLADSQRSGFRYLLTATSGEVVHLSTQAPIPEGDWDPPYMAPTEATDQMVISLPRCDTEAALAAISRLRESLAGAVTVADELEAAVTTRQMSGDLLVRHTKWCNTGGSWTAGMDPARAAAVAMYGFVPERLVDEANQPSADFEDRLDDLRRRIESL